MRDENSLKELFHQAAIFGNENGIDINEYIRTRCQKTIPSCFKNCIIRKSVGYRDNNTNEEYFRSNMYFSTIDSILVELNERKLSTTQDLLNELKLMKQTFPSTVALIIGAVTSPLSSAACGRSFSKMKLIKDYVRNSMGDERPSDLSVLAIKK